MKFKPKQKGKGKKPFKLHFDQEIKELKEKYPELEALDPATVKRFSDFPLSKKTLNGLTEAKYAHPTEIQRLSIGPALLGKDVLGAAITGSGKTLAFLIPVLEHLYLAKWTRIDGVGAIIISPTRELAYQIFETLKKIGHHHDFSAGLIIGGKNLKFERKRMDQCNILICTPGRLLQHMDENPLFNATTMQILVLDEADRCLDMGFESTLNSIIENFPPDRQTLLFSATQTNSVKDLIRLSLKDPVYVGHQKKSESTKAALPDLLQQNYVVLPLEEKITMLWSFIKNHLKQKIIVFFASCKQVKFAYEMFCKLRPGVSLLALYGSLHQDRRIAIYTEFVKKNNVVLFATDVASRGLDFPSVNWVVQLDCPEDVTQYIHRAGRSARNKTRGESLLVLTPSEEEAMVEEMKSQDINPRRIHIDPKKLFSPRLKMEAYLAQNSELKASAQRAFLSYLKSVFLMKNRKIFNVFALDYDAYAKSLGLVVTPRVKFLERFKNGKKPGEADSEEEEKKKPEKPNLFEMNDSESEDEGFITLKRADHTIQKAEAGEEVEEEDDEPLEPIRPRKEKLVTKASLAKKAIKKRIQVNEKINFDEDGEKIANTRGALQSTLAKEMMNDESVANSGGIDIELAKKLMSEEDKFDKQRFREIVKQRHRKLKEKRKRADEAAAKEATGEKDEEEADGFESGDAESDGESVDLSWLPDPDKIYNKKQKDSGDESSGDEEEEEEQRHVPGKLKRRNEPDTSEEEDSAEADEQEDYEPAPKKKVTSKLSLNDAEIIAAQLLANY